MKTKPMYYEVYLRRLDYMGSNTKDRAMKAGAREFQYKLAHSSNVDNLVLDGYAFPAIIVENKQDPNRVTKRIEVALDIPLEPGVILDWCHEKWILYQQTRAAYQPYNIFWMVRCNYLMKWVDETGLVQSTWAHLVSSQDTIVRANFRTWGRLVTPLPNKYMEALLPTLPMKRGTRILIEDEAWLMVELDRTSVPGIAYMSFTEDKVNEQTDTFVANSEKIAQYSLQVPQDPIQVVLDDPFYIPYSFYRDGKEDTSIIPTFNLPENIRENEDGTFTAISSGFSQVALVTSDHGLVGYVMVEVGDEVGQIGILVGTESIRLDRIGEYRLEGVEIVGNVSFSLSPQSEELGTIVTSEGNICQVRANKQGKLGILTLIAAYAGKTYTKEIQIVPLW